MSNTEEKEAKAKKGPDFTPDLETNESNLIPKPDMQKTNTFSDVSCNTVEQSPSFAVCKDKDTCGVVNSSVGQKLENIGAVSNPDVPPDSMAAGGSLCGNLSVKKAFKAEDATNKMEASEISDQVAGFSDEKTAHDEKSQDGNKNSGPDDVSEESRAAAAVGERKGRNLTVCIEKGLEGEAVAAENVVTSDSGTTKSPGSLAIRNLEILQRLAEDIAGGDPKKDVDEKNAKVIKKSGIDHDVDRDTANDGVNEEMNMKDLETETKSDDIHAGVSMKEEIDKRGKDVQDEESSSVGLKDVEHKLGDADEAQLVVSESDEKSGTDCDVGDRDTAGDDVNEGEHKKTKGSENGAKVDDTRAVVGREERDKREQDFGGEESSPVASNNMEDRASPDVVSEIDRLLSNYGEKPTNTIEKSGTLCDGADTTADDGMSDNQEKREKDLENELDGIPAVKPTKDGTDKAEEEIEGVASNADVEDVECESADTSEIQLVLSESDERSDCDVEDEDIGTENDGMNDCEDRKVKDFENTKVHEIHSVVPMREEMDKNEMDVEGEESPTVVSKNVEDVEHESGDVGEIQPVSSDLGRESDSNKVSETVLEMDTGDQSLGDTMTQNESLSAESSDGPEIGSPNTTQRIWSMLRNEVGSTEDDMDDDMGGFVEDLTAKKKSTEKLLVPNVKVEEEKSYSSLPKTFPGFKPRKSTFNVNFPIPESYRAVVRVNDVLGSMQHVSGNVFATPERVRIDLQILKEHFGEEFMTGFFDSATSEEEDCDSLKKIPQEFVTKGKSAPGSSTKPGPVPTATPKRGRGRPKKCESGGLKKPGCLKEAPKDKENVSNTVEKVPESPASVSEGSFCNDDTPSTKTVGIFDSSCVRNVPSSDDAETTPQGKKHLQGRGRGTQNVGGGNVFLNRQIWWENVKRKKVPRMKGIKTSVGESSETESADESAFMDSLGCNEVFDSPDRYLCPEESEVKSESVEKVRRVPMAKKSTGGNKTPKIVKEQVPDAVTKKKSAKKEKKEKMKKRLDDDHNNVKNLMSLLSMGRLEVVVERCDSMLIDSSVVVVKKEKGDSSFVDIEGVEETFAPFGNKTKPKNKSKSPGRRALLDSGSEKQSSEIDSDISVDDSLGCNQDTEEVSYENFIKSECEVEQSEENLDPVDSDIGANAKRQGARLPGSVADDQDKKTGKKKGRPPKAHKKTVKSKEIVSDSDSDQDNSKTVIKSPNDKSHEVKKRGRGRPKKVRESEIDSKKEKQPEKSEVAAFTSDEEGTTAAATLSWKNAAGSWNQSDACLKEHISSLVESPGLWGDDHLPRQTCGVTRQDSAPIFIKCSKSDPNSAVSVDSDSESDDDSLFGRKDSPKRNEVLEGQKKKEAEVKAKSSGVKKKLGPKSKKEKETEVDAFDIARNISPKREAKKMKKLGPKSKRRKSSETCEDRAESKIAMEDERKDGKEKPGPKSKRHHKTSEGSEDRAESKIAMEDERKEDKKEKPGPKSKRHKTSEASEDRAESKIAMEDERKEDKKEKPGPKSKRHKNSEASEYHGESKTVVEEDGKEKGAESLVGVQQKPLSPVAEVSRMLSECRESELDSVPEGSCDDDVVGFSDSDNDGGVADADVGDAVEQSDEEVPDWKSGLEKQRFEDESPERKEPKIKITDEELCKKHNVGSIDVKLVGLNSGVRRVLRKRKHISIHRFEKLTGTIVSKKSRKEQPRTEEDVVESQQIPEVQEEESSEVSSKHVEKQASSDTKKSFLDSLRDDEGDSSPERPVKRKSVERDLPDRKDDADVDKDADRVSHTSGESGPRFPRSDEEMAVLDEVGGDTTCSSDDAAPPLVEDDKQSSDEEEKKKGTKRVLSDSDDDNDDVSAVLSDDEEEEKKDADDVESGRKKAQDKSLPKKDAEETVMKKKVNVKEESMKKLKIARKKQKSSGASLNELLFGGGPVFGETVAPGLSSFKIPKREDKGKRSNEVKEQPEKKSKIELVKEALEKSRMEERKRNLMKRKEMEEKAKRAKAKEEEMKKSRFDTARELPDRNKSRTQNDWDMRGLSDKDHRENSGRESFGSRGNWREGPDRRGGYNRRDVGNDPRRNLDNRTRDVDPRNTRDVDPRNRFPDPRNPRDSRFSRDNPPQPAYNKPEGRKSRFDVPTSQHLDTISQNQKYGNISYATPRTYKEYKEAIRRGDLGSEPQQPHPVMPVHQPNDAPNPRMMGVPTFGDPSRQPPLSCRRELISTGRDERNTSMTSTPRPRVDEPLLHRDVNHLLQEGIQERNMAMPSPIDHSSPSDIGSHEFIGPHTPDMPEGEEENQSPEIKSSIFSLLTGKNVTGDGYHSLGEDNVESDEETGVLNKNFKKPLPVKKGDQSENVMKGKPNDPRYQGSKGRDRLDLAADDEDQTEAWFDSMMATVGDDEDEDDLYAPSEFKSTRKGAKQWDNRRDGGGRAGSFPGTSLPEGLGDKVDMGIVKTALENIKKNSLMDAFARNTGERDQLQSHRDPSKPVSPVYSTPVSSEVDLSQQFQDEVNKSRDNATQNYAKALHAPLVQSIMRFGNTPEQQDNDSNQRENNLETSLQSRGQDRDIGGHSTPNIDFDFNFQEEKLEEDFAGLRALLPKVLRPDPSNYKMTKNIPKGHCYKFVKNGSCPNRQCRFTHAIPPEPVINDIKACRRGNDLLGAAEAYAFLKTRCGKKEVRPDVVACIIELCHKTGLIEMVFQVLLPDIKELKLLNPQVCDSLITMCFPKHCQHLWEIFCFMRQSDLPVVPSTEKIYDLARELFQRHDFEKMSTVLQHWPDVAVDLNPILDFSLKSEAHLNGVVLLVEKLPKDLLVNLSIEKLGELQDRCLQCCHPHGASVLQRAVTAITAIQPPVTSITAIQPPVTSITAIQPPVTSITAIQSPPPAPVPPVPVKTPVKPHPLNDLNDSLAQFLSNGKLKDALGVFQKMLTINNADKSAASTCGVDMNFVFNQMLMAAVKNMDTRMLLMIFSIGNHGSTLNPQEAMYRLLIIHCVRTNNDGKADLLYKMSPATKQSVVNIPRKIVFSSHLSIEEIRVVVKSYVIDLCRLLRASGKIQSQDVDDFVIDVVVKKVEINAGAVKVLAAIENTIDAVNQRIIKVFKHMNPPITVELDSSSKKLTIQPESLRMHLVALERLCTTAGKEITSGAKGPQTPKTPGSKPNPSPTPRATPPCQGKPTPGGTPRS